jgi:uncharacterized protein (DUF433 family)
LSRVVDAAARRDDALGRGIYATAEALQLVNFQRLADESHKHTVSMQTITRWLCGYDYEIEGETRHLDPLWRPDYAQANANRLIELSFRDLVELRFVKTFRDQGLSLQTIRVCFGRAVEAVQDERPFSTRRFRTDGKTIFLEITSDVKEGELLDLKRRQSAFHRILAPSFRDLEFDAEVVARWFPLGASRRNIVVDPARAFGRPIVAAGGVPTEIIVQAVKIEGSPERVAALYEVPLPAVRDALEFQRHLAS